MDMLWIQCLSHQIVWNFTQHNCLRSENHTTLLSYQRMNSASPLAQKTDQWLG